MRFVGFPVKKSKGLKRQRVESEQEQTTEPTNEDDSVDDLKEEKSEGEKENALPLPPPRKKRKGDGLNVNKLRDILALEDQQTAKNIHKSLADEAREKLTASRFRYLNEQLYTQPSNAAVKLFSSDSTLFDAYHQVSYAETLYFLCCQNQFQGYQHQAKQWPLDPLNVIVTDLLRQESKAVIADLGCGAATLASPRGVLAISATVTVSLAATRSRLCTGLGTLRASLASPQPRSAITALDSCLRRSVTITFRGSKGHCLA